MKPTRRMRSASMLVAVLGLGLAAGGCGGDEADPARLWRCRNLGRAHFDNGDTRQAIAVLRECSEMAPGSYADQLNLAIATIRGSSLDEARRLLDSALKLEPSAAAPHYLRGLIALRADDFATARDELRLVTDAGQADAATWYHLGRALQRAGDLAGAEEAFREAASLDPRHASARYLLSAVLRERGADDEAREQLQLVRELRETIPEFLRTQEALEDSVHARMIAPPRPAAPRSDASSLSFADLSAGWFPGAASPAADAAFIDVDRDGDPDLVLLTDRGLVILSNSGESPLFRVSDPPAGQTEVHAGNSILAADFSHDGIADLYLDTKAGARVLLGDGDGGFTDVTEGAGLPSGSGSPSRPAAVDFDHDGDLDLVTWSRQETSSPAVLTLLANEGVPEAGAPLRFHEFEGSVAIEADDPTGILWADVDGNAGVDLLLLDRSAPGRLVLNLRQGRFAEPAGPHGWSTARGRTAAAGDLDGDLREDLLVAGDQGLRLFLGSASGDLVPDSTLLSASPAAGDIEDLLLADLDNDGDLDLVAVGGGESPLTILRNTGLTLEPVATPALAAAPVRIRAVRAADVDRDGALDLLLLPVDGAPILLRNTGDSRGRLLELRLRGLRNTGAGTGASVEVRAGADSYLRVVRGPTLALGVSDAAPVDAIRIVWPNGAMQSLTDVVPVAGGPLVIEEKREVAGSCPILYVWDGERFRMSTDLLGTSPLGFPLGDDGFLAPQGREIVKLPEAAHPVQDEGRFRFSIAEELRETVYLDRLRLLVADHDPSVEVFSNYLFHAPPFAEPEVVVLRSLRAPVLALDQHGRDVTDEVGELDRRYPVNFEPLADPFQGVASQHSIVLEFDDLDFDSRNVLVLSGWTDWTDGPSESATDQHRELTLDLPVVEVPDDGGGWRPVTGWFGFPSLKPKEILIDLSGKLNPGDPRLRLSTNLMVYWDRVRIGERVTEGLGSLMTLHSLTPVRATLRHKGVSLQSSPDGRLPEIYRRDRIRPTPVWRSQSGLATRYGDVTELLGKADDLMVVFTMGDEVLVEFEASTLPGSPRTWRRSFLLSSHGWEKEGDYYTALANAVEPLPFRRMSGYPYDPTREHYPLTDATLRYLLETNTRPIGIQQ